MPRSNLIDIPILFLCVIPLLFVTNHGHPVSDSDREEKLSQLFFDTPHVDGNRVDIAEKVLIYLTHFGYLPNYPSYSKSSTSSLIDFHDVDTIKHAIGKFQINSELPISRVIDDRILSEISKPVCGTHDFEYTGSTNHSLKRKKRYILYSNGKYKWSKRILTYSILNFPRKSLSRSQVRRAIRRSFNLWARSSNLTFHEIDQDDRADIRFSFVSRKHGDGIPFDGPMNVLAHAFFPKSGSLTGAVHLDNEENWTDGTTVGANLYGVVAHELGHTFGLRHSLVKNSIMKPVFTGYDPHLALDQDDIYAIQYLYGPPAPNKHIEGEEGSRHYTLPPYVSTTPHPTTTIPGAPSVCQTKIDAILPVRGHEIQVFHGKFFWRIVRRETGDGFFSYELKEKPRLFRNYWTGLPSNLERIDAAFERNDGNFMFFRGTRFWILRSNNARYGSMNANGRPLQDLGLPSTIKKVDAIFTWGYVPPYERRGYKKRTYLFTGEQFYEFNEGYTAYGAVDHQRFPLRISDVWNHVPTPIDTAYTHTDGETYFFRGYHYYSFNNRLMRVRDGYPKLSKLPWLGCDDNYITE